APAAADTLHKYERPAVGLAAGEKRRFFHSKGFRAAVVPAVLIGYGISTINGHGFYSSYDAKSDINHLFGPGRHTHRVRGEKPDQHHPARWHGHGLPVGAHGAGVSGRQHRAHRAAREEPVVRGRGLHHCHRRGRPAHAKRQALGIRRVCRGGLRHPLGPPGLPHPPPPLGPQAAGRSLVAEDTRRHPTVLGDENLRHHAGRNSRRPAFHDPERGLRRQLAHPIQHFSGGAGGAAGRAPLRAGALLGRDTGHQHGRHHALRLHGPHPGPGHGTGRFSGRRLGPGLWGRGAAHWQPTGRGGAGALRHAGAGRAAVLGGLCAHAALWGHVWRPVDQDA
nr:hypothetical protein [Tanacetum cinerariifolium]